MTEIFGQLIEIGLLFGIFQRLGRIGATLDNHEKRLTTIERFKNVILG